jgi:predicted nucleic acid-binding protein
MRFLLDTNCWMQLARRRERYEEVAQLLREVPSEAICISDYALHSLINITRRHKMLAELPAFIAKSGFGNTVAVIGVAPQSIREVVDVIGTHQLDVDDAYQYVAAQLNGLRLVSLDTDFDRTPNGRLTPAAALALFREEQQQQGKQNPA